MLVIQKSVLSFCNVLYGNLGHFKESLADLNWAEAPLRLSDHLFYEDFVLDT